MSQQGLESLNDSEINDYKLKIGSIEPGRFEGEINFTIFLEKNGKLSDNSLVEGKFYFGNRKFHDPWIDFHYQEKVMVGEEQVDISGGEDLTIFQEISSILPPGSRMMVAYTNHGETYRGLNLGFPVPITPIGFLLWKSDFRWFKNWYFAEGFREGHIKLQGNKPVNKENRIKNLLRTQKELNQFLNKELSTEEIHQKAKKRAKSLIPDIKDELSEYGHQR